MMDLKKNITIDCRSEVCNLRYEKISDSFKSLKEGEIINLITNSDPKKLYFEILDKEKGNFYWIYTDDGPDKWDVIIEKTLVV